ncbi:DUF4238 domain-containing protein [Kribbella sp. NPDC056345]|uniref:DUF4238 domain-containing protein n=1 Tax=Kribbella sp. NPDC056345 TaxID=3345789 RepID=UPI0035E2BEDC
MPQFVLRNFAHESTGKVAAFDKAARRFSYVGVPSAAQVPNFNRDSFGDETVELLLGREVETPAASALKQLIDSTSQAELRPEQVHALRRLVVVQAVRGTRQRRVNTLMTREAADLISLGGLDFDEGDHLTQDSQLRITRSFLNAWQYLGCASWDMEFLDFEIGSSSGLLLPDQGVVAFHPDLVTHGWTDSSIDEMSCLYMPISPHHALILVNPLISRTVAVPDSQQLVAVAYGQADRYLYGQMDAAMRDHLRSMGPRDTPEGGAPTP